MYIFLGLACLISVIYNQIQRDGIVSHLVIHMQFVIYIFYCIKPDVSQTFVTIRFGQC